MLKRRWLVIGALWGILLSALIMTVSAQDGTIVPSTPDIPTPTDTSTPSTVEIPTAVPDDSPGATLTATDLPIPSSVPSDTPTPPASESETAAPTLLETEAINEVTEAPETISADSMITVTATIAALTPTPADTEVEVTAEATTSASDTPTPGDSACPAYVGSVTNDDLLRIAALLHTPGTAPDYLEDINNDHIVDLQDFDLVVEQIGSSRQTVFCHR